MNNNTPILTQSEEERAPWNQKVRYIEVIISQSLSTTTNIEVPADLKDYDDLKKYVEEQVFLPSDFKDVRDWNVDEFCVICNEI